MANVGLFGGDGRSRRLRGGSAEAAWGDSSRLCSEGWVTEAIGGSGASASQTHLPTSCPMSENSLASTMIMHVTLTIAPVNAGGIQVFF